MKHPLPQQKLGIISFLTTLVFTLSAASHLSTERGQNHQFRTIPYHAHQSSQQQLSSKPSKGAVSQTMVFNRQLPNLHINQTMRTQYSRYMEHPQQNYLDMDQREMEMTNRPLSNRNALSDKLSESESPFSISIEGKQFYGGLITYSHNLHPALICRVVNGCIRNDDTLVLPRWMQRHDNALKFQCGFPNIDFSLPDNESPPPLKKLDLVGITSSRPSMPDFIADFIPSAVVFDLAYGGHQVSKSCHSRKGTDCFSFPTLEESFRPAVILDPRIRSLGETKSWVRQFIRFMKPTYSGKETEILYMDSFREKHADLTCFRSVLFTRGPFNRNLIMDDHLRQIHFIDGHGIVKKPREVILSQDSFSSRKICALNVTITNRKPLDGVHNRLTGRYITNIRAIRDAILERAQRIPGLHLNLETMTLEDKSLRWQINAMQKTDIWVAGHGPLLTNMLFLREGSSVLELQPFAYYPQTFEMIAQRLAHVRHERYIADPDVEAFKTCMSQIYDERHPARSEASTLLDRYLLASKKYFETDNTHTLILHNLRGEDMLPVKKCAQMQRLTVNALNFAVAVVRHARVRCGFPKPGLNNIVAQQN